jgi:hypothetical protein
MLNIQQMRSTATPTKCYFAIAMRFTTVTLLLAAIMLATPTPAHAGSVTYTYAGRPYSPNAPTFCDGSYTATCSQLAVTGSFTVANPLAPNLSQYVFSPLSFSFNDGSGVFSLTSDDELGVSIFNVTTDGDGNIIYWNIVLATVSSTGCLVNNELIGTSSSQFNGQSGDYSCYLFDQNLPTQAFGAGQNSGTPGSWSRSFSVNPQGSYIFLNTVGGGTASEPADIVVAPLIINLSSIGLTAGNIISSTAVGDYAYSCYPNTLGCATIPALLCGLFSSSDVILPPGTPADPTINRVPGAITPNFSTVAQCITPPSLFGNVPTDISQDFVLNSALVTIPTGAQYLIVAVPDSYYADNADPDGSLAVQIALSAPPTSQLITQSLSPTGPNTFNFGPHNFTVQYPPGTSFSNVQMTALAAQISEGTFEGRVAGTPFASAQCIVYEGESGYCEDYQVSCTDTAGNSISCPSVSTPTISVKTSYDTEQGIINPGFLTAPLGTNNWSNIFESFYLQRIDPTTKGRTTGFSEFVAVALGASNSQGSGQFTMLAPLQQDDVRVFPVGTLIPVVFQLASTSEPVQPVTDATAGVTVTMVTDSNGNPTSTIVTDRPSAFRFSDGEYRYYLSTLRYLPGTYVVTVYGNAFAAQQVEFTLPASTSGVELQTTLQSLTFDSGANQYVAVLNVTNTSSVEANGVIVVLSALNLALTSSALPYSLGDIGPGTSAAVTLTYPAGAGQQGSPAALTAVEAFAGGAVPVFIPVKLP